MKRGRSTSTPTKAQRMRFDSIREIGCIVARRKGLGFVPCEVHHLTVGGHHGQKRRGHDATIGLNSWSHRGVPLPGWNAAHCERVFGPSYAREPRRFREEIGDDETLLAFQNELLANEWRNAA